MTVARSSILPILVAALVLAPGTAAGQSRGGAPILVSTSWLAQHLRDGNVVVIHISNQKADYDAGHVPGARFLAWASFTTQRNGLSTELPDAAQLDSALEGVGISDNSHIVITGGPITMTARLFYTLDYFGMGQATSLLDGGIDAWREEGRPLEYESREVAAGHLTLHPQPSRLVDAAWIQAHASAPGHSIDVLDARVPEFYAGLSANNTPRAGHLPMARNIPFSWLTGEFSRFRDASKLERLFTSAGVAPGDTVVTYCHIGMQASVLYMAARILGHPAAVYDGSFEDWSRRSELPIGGASVKPPDH